MAQKGSQFRAEPGAYTPSRLLGATWLRACNTAGRADHVNAS